MFGIKDSFNNRYLGIFAPMKIYAQTKSICINQNDWSSCRYTKGEGFDILDNTNGIFLEYVQVFVDDVDAFLSMGGSVAAALKIERIQHPELEYILDVNKCEDENIPQPDASMVPSLREINKYLKENPSIQAEVSLEMDESYSLVSNKVTLEAFQEISL